MPALPHKSPTGVINLIQKVRTCGSKMKGQAWAPPATEDRIGTQIRDTQVRTSRSSSLAPACSPIITAHRVPLVPTSRVIASSGKPVFLSQNTSLLVGLVLDLKAVLLSFLPQMPPQISHKKKLPEFCMNPPPKRSQGKTK